MEGRYKEIARDLVTGVALAALLPGVAFAQAPTMSQSVPPAASAAAADPTNGSDIVVTGTLIRGIAPAGSNVVSFGAEQAKATGAITTDQILSNIPQMATFNQLQQGVSPTSGSNASNPITRPNLRNLPGGNTSGGAQTLVLLDGNRVVGAGTQQIAVDPDIIAPGVIERVEAMTDGGSAVYGSDALGGVLNFITRRRFDGLQVGARYGFGDDYHSFDANGMLGKDWGTGSAYVAHGYSHHNSIFGVDRDFAKQINWATGVPVGRNCANPNVTVAGTGYVVSGAGLAVGGPNVCDNADDLAIYPEITLHTGFARLTQDLNDAVHFDVTALYANRRIIGNGGTLGSGALGSGATGNVTLTAANPSYRSTGGATATAAETVLFNYGPLLGYRSAVQDTRLTTLSIDPSLSVKLGGGWQARGLFSYGISKVDYANAQVGTAAQSAAIASGALNPFAVGSAGAGTVASLVGYDRGQGRNELYDYKAIVDGPLFKLPGGEVRVAVGGEHMQDNFRRQISSAALILQAPTYYTQKVDSGFGELQIPIVGADNAGGIVQQLGVSASARYDRYNDFGHTFNPKVGITYKPVGWLTFRGNWGKSFNAPTPVDQLGKLASTASLIPGAFLQPPPGRTFVAGETGVFLGNGAVSDLTPQKATEWSIGAEIKPPVIEGLTLNASYYHIDLNGTIGRPTASASLAPFYNNFPNLWILRPSGQQLAAFLSTLNPGNVNFTVVNPTSTNQALVSSGGSAPQPVGVALDTLTRNLGKTKLDGIDFSASYVLRTGFGSIDGSVAGNVRLTQKTRVSPTAPLSDDLLTETPTTTFAATLGTTVHTVRTQVTWNHTAGYRRGDAGQATAFGQVRVKSFDTINVFGRYGLPESLLGKDMELTVTVQNLFDVAPPVLRSSTAYGYEASRSFTIGRIIQLGFNKKF